MASEILGRRASTAEDFREALNVELVDILSELRTADRLLALGRNVVGPRDGLYVLDDGDTYRVYLQERGEIVTGVGDADFDTAVEVAIDILIKLTGIPSTPPGWS